MADLSQLSDEQLAVYRDLLAKKQAAKSGPDMTAAPPVSGQIPGMEKLGGSAPGITTERMVPVHQMFSSDPAVVPLRQASRYAARDKAFEDLNAEPPKDTRGFLQSAWDTSLPAGLYREGKEYLTNPAEWQRKQNPMGYDLGSAQPAVTAGSQMMQGNVKGGMGTLTGAYGPVVAGVAATPVGRAGIKGGFKGAVEAAVKPSKIPIRDLTVGDVVHTTIPAVIGGVVGETAGAPFGPTGRVVGGAVGAALPRVVWGGMKGAVKGAFGWSPKMEEVSPGRWVKRGTELTPEEATGTTQGGVSYSTIPDRPEAGTQRTRPLTQTELGYEAQAATKSEPTPPSGLEAITGETKGTPRATPPPYEKGRTFPPRTRPLTETEQAYEAQAAAQRASERTPPAAVEETGPSQGFLDDLAALRGKKSFSQLSPEDQATVRDLAKQHPEWAKDYKAPAESPKPAEAAPSATQESTSPPAQETTSTVKPDTPDTSLEDQLRASIAKVNEEKTGTQSISRGETTGTRTEATTGTSAAPQTIRHGDVSFTIEPVAGTGRHVVKDHEGNVVRGGLAQEIMRSYHAERQAKTIGTAPQMVSRLKTLGASREGIEALDKNARKQLFDTAGNWPGVSLQKKRYSPHPDTQEQVLSSLPQTIGEADFSSPMHESLSADPHKSIAEGIRQMFRDQVQAQTTPEIGTAEAETAQGTYAAGGLLPEYRPLPSRGLRMIPGRFSHA